jgi:signal transduction histidine kinase
MAWQPAFRPAAVLAALIILLAGVVSVWAGRVQSSAAGWVTHTYEVIAELESVLSGLGSAESAQRAYLLTGDERLFAGFERGHEQARAGLRNASELTGDNPRQQERLAPLREALDDRFDTLRRAAQLRRDGQPDGAVELMRSHGLGQSEGIRRRIDEMRRAERELLAGRLDTARRAEVLGLLSDTGSAALALAALAALYSLGRTQARRLEERVRQRTAELAEVNTELEAYARTIAHDLRAPLRNIHGLADALLEDERPRLSADGMRYAQRMIASAGRMEAMVSDILQYSQLVRSKLVLVPVPLDPLVQQVLQDWRADIEARRAQVEVRSPLPTVLADAATLARVIGNLVSNALKFVRAGQAAEVRIDAHADGDFWILGVHDRGIGIEVAAQERIFSVFERLHGQEEFPGTGIGLAIVQKAMERMAGRVTVRSEPGEGSSFLLHLRAPHPQ